MSKELENLKIGSKIEVYLERIETFKEELIAKCFHPDRLVRYLEVYNYDIGEDEYQD